MAKPAPKDQPMHVVKEPEWVVAMHTHYQKTGVYRAKDLDRVLGDPRKQVSGDPADYSLASKLGPK